MRISRLFHILSTWLFRTPLETPLATPDPEALKNVVERLLAVERQVRLLQGRVNKIAPPRASSRETPETPPQLTPPAPDPVSDGTGLLHRSDELAAFRASRHGGFR